MSTVIGQSSVFLCTYIYRCCNHCCHVGIEKDIDLHTVSVPHTQNHMILEKKDTQRVNFRLDNYYSENIHPGSRIIRTGK